MTMPDSQRFPWNLYATFVDKLQLIILSFKSYLQWYLIHTNSDKGFKGTVVNLALSYSHVGLLKTMVTGPLSILSQMPYSYAPWTFKNENP